MAARTEKNPDEPTSETVTTADPAELQGVGPDITDDLVELTDLDRPRLTALRAVRAPFPPNQIGKLPQGVCKQCKEAGPYAACGQRRGGQVHEMLWGCPVCGGNHSSDHIHLDYVGHAALTARLLDVDPTWSWDFLTTTPDGLPLLDRDGNLWITLTIAGVTRKGVGDGKNMKERIGDALRNAGMRFGIALDLWHKGGDLYGGEAAEPTPPRQAAAQAQPEPDPAPPVNQAEIDAIVGMLMQAVSAKEVNSVWEFAAGRAKAGLITGREPVLWDGGERPLIDVIKAHGTALAQMERDAAAATPENEPPTEPDSGMGASVTADEPPF